MNFMYDLLQRKNPASDLLNEKFWDLRPKINDELRAKILALLYNGKVEEAESILKNL